MVRLKPSNCLHGTRTNDAINLPVIVALVSKFGLDRHCQIVPVVSTVLRAVGSTILIAVGSTVLIAVGWRIAVVGIIAVIRIPSVPPSGPSPPPPRLEAERPEIKSDEEIVSEKELVFFPLLVLKTLLAFETALPPKALVAEPTPAVEGPIPELIPAMKETITPIHEPVAKRWIAALGKTAHSVTAKETTPHHWATPHHGATPSGHPSHVPATHSSSHVPTATSHSLRVHSLHRNGQKYCKGCWHQPAE